LQLIPEYAFESGTKVFEQYIEGNESRSYQMMVYNKKKKYKVSTDYQLNFQLEELEYVESEESFLSNPKCCKSDMEYYILSAGNPIIRCMSEFKSLDDEVRINSTVAY